MTRFVRVRFGAWRDGPVEVTEVDRWAAFFLDRVRASEDEGKAKTMHTAIADETKVMDFFTQRLFRVKKIRVKTKSRIKSSRYVDSAYVKRPVWRTENGSFCNDLSGLKSDSLTHGTGRDRGTGDAADPEPSTRGRVRSESVENPGTLERPAGPQRYARSR
jgi:hypothetical protein